MGKNISLKGRMISDTIAIDHGTEAISLSIFKGDIRPGITGHVTHVEMNPTQAEWLAAELLRRVKELRK